MSTYSIQWLVLAADASIKSLLLAITAGVILRGLRVRDSQVRHRVWTGVLVGVLLLPGLSQVVPDLRLPFIVQPEWLTMSVDEVPATFPPAEPTLVAAAGEQTAEGAATDGEVLPPLQSLEATPNEFSFRDFQGLSDRGLVPVDQALPAAALPPADIVMAPPEPPAVGAAAPAAGVAGPWLMRLRDRWPQLLVCLWLTVVAFIALRLLLGVLMAWRLQRASIEIHPQDLAELGVSRAPGRGRRLVPVLECPLVRVPLTLGFLRPVILLPESWLEWPREKLQAVLSHEQTHVERGDCAVAFLAEINLCLNWFHPLSWWLRRVLSVLAEEACDDAAIGAIGDRATYARHLLEVAAAVSPSHGRLIEPGVAMARRCNIENRIDAILDFTRPISERPTWTTTLVILALATPVIALAAALRPAGPRPSDATLQEHVDTTGTRAAASNLLALAETADGRRSSGQDIAGRRRYSGRVADMDGRLMAGAQIWLGIGRTEETSTLTQVATSQQTGEFSFELTPETAARCDEQMASPTLVARQPGYGLDFLPLEVFAEGAASISAGGGQSEATARQMARVDQVLGEGRAASKTLKLKPQGAPVQGRLVTIEGQPLAEVRIAVLSLQEPEVDTLLSAFERKSKELYFKAINSASVPGRHLRTRHLRTLIPPVTTDASGAFTLPGLGSDQLATLTFEGERVDAATLHVVVRDMETQRIPHLDSSPGGNQETYVGRNFTHVLGPGVPVTGIVKDFKTGEPIPDATVYVERLFRETGGTTNHLRLDVQHIRATTDAQGRYRLLGIPPGGRHVLNALPPTTQQPWFGAEQEFSVEPDATEMKVDIEVFRGIWIEGRVTDASTGEAVQGYVEYMALQDNPNIPQTFGLRDVFQFAQFSIGDDGGYRTVGLPGPGVLMVRNVGKTKYPLEVGAEDVPGYNPGDDWLPTTPTRLPLSNWALLRPINPANDSGSFRCDLTLSAGEPVVGRVLGADGKPLSSFEALKLVEKKAFWEACQNGSFTLHNYDGKGPRHVFFRSLDLSQVGQWHLEGAAPGDVVVRLEPAVRVSGRLIETETNEPADGYHLYCDHCSAGAFRLEESLTTDDDGRFTIKGLVAGLTYKIKTASRKRFSSGKNDFTIDLTSTRPGDVLDLGDVTGKNAAAVEKVAGPATTAMSSTVDKVPDESATTGPPASVTQLVRGRLIDTEGRPVDGATVRVVELETANSARLGEWIEAQRREAAAGRSSGTVMTLQQQAQWRPPSGPTVELAPDSIVATTDADGRFEIDGIGLDSIAILKMEKAGLATVLVDVIVRDMELLRIGGESARDRRVYHGAQFDYVLEPDAPVRGRLTDADSGEPIEGAHVSVSIDEVNSDRRKLAEMTVRTDASGRYEVGGLPRRRGNRLSVRFTDQPYLPVESLTIPRPPASGPTTFDVAFKRGVWVSGVVKDHQTGHPVKGKICYTPFANNEFLKQHPRYSMGVRRMLEHFPSGETDAEGRYRVLVIQGRGIVCFQAADRSAYVPGFGLQAIADLKNLNVDVIDLGLDVSFHALKEIKPAADTQEVTADLEVDRGRTITFRFVDPEGRRLTSVRADGLKTRSGKPGEAADLRFASAAEPQCLTLVDDHTGFRSILRFTPQPGQTEATVTLTAPARLTGRLVDVDGKPLKDLPLDAYFSPQVGWASSPPYSKSDPQPVSDHDGRFTMLLPAGENLNVFIRSPSGVSKSIRNDLIATPGETIELGDVEIDTESRAAAKPLQPEKRTPASAQAVPPAEGKPVATIEEKQADPTAEKKGDWTTAQAAGTKPADETASTPAPAGM